MRASLLLLAMLASSPARADDDKATAEAAFIKATSLANEGKWVEACPLFRTSYQADRQIGVLLHLADCDERIGKLATAWSEFREAEERAGKVADARAALARQRAEALLPRLSKLVVTAPAVPGLVVTRGATDITRLLGIEAPVDPGEHLIVARAPGYVELKQTVTISGEGSITKHELPALAKALEPPPPQVIVAQVSYDFSARDARRRVAYRIAIPAAVVTALGVGLAVKAKRDYDDTKDNPDLCDAAFVCTEAGRDQIAGARRNALIGDLATGVGVAGLVTGIVLFATAPEGVEKPRIIPTGSGVALVGSF